MVESMDRDVVFCVYLVLGFLSVLMVSLTCGICLLSRHKSLVGLVLGFLCVEVSLPCGICLLSRH
jgi:hypothetical protein